jgi:hypothetical protein
MGIWTQKSSYNWGFLCLEVFFKNEDVGNCLMLEHMRNAKNNETIFL